MRFWELAEYFAKIKKTSLRNEKTSILAELLVKVSESEVEAVVYLALGRLRPKFDRLEFALAEKMLMRVVARVLGVGVDEVLRRYRETGELSELVSEMRMGGKSELEVDQVYQRLEEIAREYGMGSQEKKVRGLEELLSAMDGLSAGYVVRVVMGKLRLGFSDKTVLDALSYMEYGDKRGRKILDQSYQVFPDVGKIAKVVKQSGIEALPKLVGVRLGTPIMSALAQRLKTAQEMIEKMGEVVSEPKFDGQRSQLHWRRNGGDDSEIEGQGSLFETEVKNKDWVRSFTRNLDENSRMFPELARLGEQIKANEIVLDTEAVGYDPETGEMLPFQMTIKRKRKHGIEQLAKEIPLKFNVFDVMYLDGESLLDRPLIERRRILSQVIKQDKDGVLVVDDYLVTDDPDELREYHRQQLAKGYEGAMVKKKLGAYLPGRQDFNWVKFKEMEDSEAKLADTLDVVVMGYFRGKGKRAKFGLGALLVGVRKGEEVVTVAKIGTGISDSQFVELGERLMGLRASERPSEYRVAKGLEPDVWVRPELVMEIAGDEITQSPVHTAGVAIRFPRMVRIREDKSLSEVTSLKEVEEIQR